MLGHNSLENYYQSLFSLVQHHKYSLTEVENLIPYELELYMMLLIKHLKEQERLAKERQQSNK